MNSFLRLAGGLGNQLFQLAYFTTNVSKSKNPNFFINPSYLTKYKVDRSFAVDQVVDLEKMKIKIQKEKNVIFTCRLAKLFSQQNRLFAFINDKNSYKEPLESWYHFFDGYFIWALSKNDFYASAEELYKNIFPRFKKNIYNTCTIHVRGNDFNTLGWNSHTAVHYYQGAMNYFAKSQNIKSFSIVTDDLDYAKSIFNGNQHNVNFISSNQISDFEFLMNSKFKIISGSSFAIWASIFGSFNNSTITISPNSSYMIPNMVFLK